MRWTSHRTASVQGIWMASAYEAARSFPMTWSISSWTRSYEKRGKYCNKKSRTPMSGRAWVQWPLIIIVCGAQCNDSAQIQSSAYEFYLNAKVFFFLSSSVSQNSNDLEHVRTRHKFTHDSIKWRSISKDTISCYHQWLLVSKACLLIYMIMSQALPFA